MKVKYAIFDMDGTVVDSLFFWGMKWKEFGSKYLGIENYSAPAELDHKVRTMRMRESAVYIKNTLNVNISDEEADGFFNSNLPAFYKKNAKVKDGMARLISEMKQNGISMCLATATESAVAREVMQYFSLEEYFHDIISCADADINEGKESPKIYLTALERLGADKSDTVVFEDSDVALATAKSIGIATVGIKDRYIDNSEKLKKYADYYIDENENIYDALANQNAFEGSLFLKV